MQQSWFELNYLYSLGTIKTKVYEFGFYETSDGENQSWNFKQLLFNYYYDAFYLVKIFLRGCELISLDFQMLAFVNVAANSLLDLLKASEECLVLRLQVGHFVLCCA